MILNYVAHWIQDDDADKSEAPPPLVLVPVHEQQAQPGSTVANSAPAQQDPDDGEEHVAQHDIYHGYTPAYNHDYSSAPGPYFEPAPLEYDFAGASVQVEETECTGVPALAPTSESQIRRGEPIQTQRVPSSYGSEHVGRGSANVDPGLAEFFPDLQPHHHDAVLQRQEQQAVMAQNQQHVPVPVVQNQHHAPVVQDQQHGPVVETQQHVPAVQDQQHVPIWQDQQQVPVTWQQPAAMTQHHFHAPVVQNQQLVPQPIQSSTGLLFSSFSDAKSTIPDRGWRSPSPDYSIPIYDHQRQEIVVRLVTAINNTEGISDARSKNFQKRWMPPTNGAPVFYQATDKEHVAWSILGLAESLHLYGPTVFTSFDPVFCHQTSATRDYTFAQRIDHIVELLTISKARCEKLLAGTCLQDVVGHPAYLIRMTKANSKQNGTRQKMLEAGRAAKKAKA